MKLFITFCKVLVTTLLIAVGIAWSHNFDYPVWSAIGYAAIVQGLSIAIALTGLLITYDKDDKRF